MNKVILLVLTSLSLAACSTLNTSHKVRTPSSTDDNSGIIVTSPEAAVHYTLSEFKNADTTNSNDKFWHAYYPLKYNVGGMSETTCYFGQKTEAAKVILGLFEGTLQIVKEGFLTTNKKEVDVATYQPTSNRNLVFRISDTRDRKDYGAIKTVEIKECNTQPGLFSINL